MSVQDHGSLESQISWHMAQSNKKLVTKPFSSQNLCMEPAMQDFSLNFGFQPNGQTNKILLKKPSKPAASWNQDVVISTINLGDSPSYPQAEDLFSDLHAFGGDSNRDDLMIENPAEGISDFWDINNTPASLDAALKTTSNPMLLVDPNDVEGLSGDAVTQDVEGVGGNMTQDVTAPSYHQSVFGLNNDIDFSAIDFDLFNSVLDRGIGVDDPTFQSLIGNFDEAGFAAANSIKGLEDLGLTDDSKGSAQDMTAPATSAAFEAVPLVKRRRGRPPIIRPPVPAAPKRRGRPPSMATSSTPAYSSDDPDEARYRRMRDLNNEASRRCRLKKKRKVETHDHALKYEEDRNAELQMQVRLLKEQISKLKNAAIKKCVKKSR